MSQELSEVDLVPDLGTDRPPSRSSTRVMLHLAIAAVVALVATAVVVAAGRDDAVGPARPAGAGQVPPEDVAFRFELELESHGIATADGTDGGADPLSFTAAGEVIARDRYAVRSTSPAGYRETIRVGATDYVRGAPTAASVDDAGWQSFPHDPPVPWTPGDVEAALAGAREGGVGDAAADDARSVAIAMIHFGDLARDPWRLWELIDAAGLGDPDIGSGASEDVIADGAAPVTGAPAEGPAAGALSLGEGVVAFPPGYEAVLPDVADMSVALEIGEDGWPVAAQLVVEDHGGTFLARARFADWGAALTVEAPIGDDDAAPDSTSSTTIKDTETAPDTAPVERGIDSTLTPWLPTAWPEGFELVDLVSADTSGDDRCAGVFVVWMSRDRPAADWVSQDTPDRDNSQLLTVMSVPADCHFVPRLPLFEPGPFGDVPARRTGDLVEVLVDDDWVVRFDSVVATWDEIVAMVGSLEPTPLQPLLEQLDPEEAAVPTP